MMGSEAYRLENTYPVRVIDSAASGLCYVVDGEGRGLIISGQRGMTGLSRRQAVALWREIGGVLRDHLGVETTEQERDV